jgi:hypothetical protein
VTPDELAELAHWHITLGSDLAGWQRFWRRLAQLTAGTPLEVDTEVLVGDGARLAGIVAHLLPEAVGW